MTDQRAEPPLHPGDIVQITAQANRWFPALVVVDEPKAWGFTGFCWIPGKGPPADTAYYRVQRGEFEVVGRVVVMSPAMAKARDASLATAAQLAADRGERDPAIVLAAVKRAALDAVDDFPAHDALAPDDYALMKRTIGVAIEIAERDAQ
jgi:hypothetical protein